jgi:SNF2 family DNA or RNA helicase
VRFFVANPQAGGTGLTLTAANTAIYFSNSFSLEERLQSEDRCHRIGTKEPVVYIDLVAADTVDERIAAALQSKAATAEEILAFELDRSATENDRSTAA